jgi:cytochrome c peroxidase
MKIKFSNQKKIVAQLSSGICFLIVLFSGCLKKDDPLASVIMGTSPTPKLPANTYSYEFGENAKATLGRVLFYDKNLSLNNAISCGSCHIQSRGFADKTQFSQGLNNGYTARNTSSLVSSNFHSHFWDGRADNYEIAVFMPVMNHVEMNMFNLNILPEKLSHLPYYSALFQSAFGSPEITVDGIRQSIAWFVSSLTSHNSKYDRGNLNAFEQNGQQIFHGKAKCYSCHNGQDLNGYGSDYEDIGLEVNYADKGRGKITNNTQDDGKFNVPTLRNIGLTAPYMHDGRYKTLRDVIDHYSDGIQDSPNLSWVFRNIPSGFFDSGGASSQFVDVQGSFPAFPVLSINLTETEKRDLEAFLNTLTDEQFVTDPRYSNPF